MSTIQYGPECEPSRYVAVIGAYYWTPVPTHEGCPGGSNTPGLIGGWSCPCACHTKQPGGSTEVGDSS